MVYTLYTYWVFTENSVAFVGYKVINKVFLRLFTLYIRR